MLQGRAGRDGYALFLCNLVPAYRFLEAALRRQARDPRLAAFAVPALYREAPLQADCAALAALGARLPVRLPSAVAYAARIAAADAPRLLAHAYVRYLGDLSGGRILGRLLARSPGLGPEALHFYAFPGIAEPEVFRDGLRRAIDAAPLSACEQEHALTDACLAFDHNIRLSLEVAAMVRSRHDTDGVAPPG